MSNDIKINADNVDVAQIMRQIHSNLKTRGYDVEEVKKLSKGINSNNDISKSFGETLKGSTQKVFGTRHIQFWWQMHSQKSPVGRFKNFIKKVVRKLSYFYMKHVFDQQNIFNTNVSESINGLLEYCNKLSVVSKMIETENEELRTNITSLTKKLDELGISNADDEIFANYYRKFENEFRGPEEEIKNRQQKYVKYFAGCNNVVDIGCGRGEFLSLLKENGVSATGIDLSPHNIKECNEKGFHVAVGDGIEYLSGLLDESVDGIFCAQVIEHISIKELINLITTAYKKLQKDSVLIMETLNPECLMIFAQSFYMDPTHKFPVHPKTLSFFSKEAGFSDVKVEYFTPSDEKLSFNLNDTSMEKLNELIFGNREYAVIARK